MVDIFKLGLFRVTIKVTNYNENKLKNVYSTEESPSLIYCDLSVVITKINQPPTRK